MEIKGGSRSQNITMQSNGRVPEERDLYSMRVYFSRRAHDLCMDGKPHNITLHVVLEDKSKLEEFEKVELPDLRLEKAAERLRFPIFPSQVYTPILGTCLKTFPEDITWDGGCLASFSYRQVVQNGGFMELEKIPPPKMTLCCNGDYRMIKLLKSNMNEEEQLPEGAIFTNGVALYPWECQGLHSSPASTTEAMSPYGIHAMGSSVKATGLCGSVSGTTETLVRSAGPMEANLRSAIPIDTCITYPKGAIVSDSSATKANVSSALNSSDGEPETLYSSDGVARNIIRSSESRLETDVTNEGASIVGATSILPAVSAQSVKVPGESAQISKYIVDSANSMDSKDITSGNIKLTGKSTLQDLVGSRTQLKYQCPHCPKKLTRKQTFLMHTDKYHPGLPGTLPSAKLDDKTIGSIKGLEMPLVNKTSTEFVSSLKPQSYQSLTLLPKINTSKSFKATNEPYPTILRKFTILPYNTITATATSFFQTVCSTSSGGSSVGISMLNSLQKQKETKP